MESQYFQFWNEKAESLCRNPRFQKWSKLSLEGVINSSWTLRKTTLLRDQIRVSELELDEIKRQHPDWHRDIPNLGSIRRNEDRMTAARHAIEEQEKEAQKIQKDLKTCTNEETRAQKKRKLKECQNNIDGLYSDLKKAQDALRKNVKSLEQKVEQLKEKMCTEIDENDVLFLSTDVENSLAKDIKNEKEMEQLNEDH